MPDLNDMATFARVVEARSFSAAAGGMKVSKSRVSKSVARLERTLGARLLNRSTRRMSLTEAGEAFYGHCRRILDEAARARQAVSRHLAAPHGVIKLAAPPAFGTLRLAPALPAFLARHQEVRIDLTISRRTPDIVGGGYDLAIQVARQPEPSLAARRIAPAPRLICAAPEYLRSRGMPTRLDHLARHNCLHVTGIWHLQAGDLAVQGTLRADDERTLWQAALGGLGLALLPAYMVENDLGCGRLVRVLPDYPPAEESAYALRMPGAHVAPKVRALFDYLIERFGPVVERPHGEDPGPRGRLEDFRPRGEARARPACGRDGAAGAAAGGPHPAP